MGRVNQRLIFIQHFFGIDGSREGLVFDLDQLHRVFRDITGIRDNGSHPFAGIARHPDGQRVPDNIGQIQAVKQRVRRFGNLIACQDIMHTGQRQRGAGIDADDIRAGMGARQNGNMLHAGNVYVGDKFATAADEPPVFLGPALARYVAVIRQGCGGISHVRLLRGDASPSFVPLRQSAGSRCTGTDCR